MTFDVDDFILSKDKEFFGRFIFLKWDILWCHLVQFLFLLEENIHKIHKEFWKLFMQFKIYYVN